MQAEPVWQLNELPFWSEFKKSVFRRMINPKATGVGGAKRLGDNFLARNKALVFCFDPFAFCQRKEFFIDRV